MENARSRDHVPLMRTHSFTLFYEFNFATLLHISYIEQLSGYKLFFRFSRPPQTDSCSKIECD